MPFTAAKFSPDYEWVVYATGYDWCEGIFGLENAKKPKIFACKISSDDLAKMTKNR